MKLLLVNPPIYDFTAYDFWSRPLGLLAVAGQLRGRAHMRLFDFMDRTASRDREGAVFPASDSSSVAPPSLSAPVWALGGVPVGHAVYQLTRRGSGENAASRGDAPSARRLLDDVHEALRFVLLREKCDQLHMVGISWGGKLAACYCCEPQSAGVSSLALVAPGIVPRVDLPPAKKLAVAWSLLANPRRMFDIPLSDVELFTDNPAMRDYLRRDPLRLHRATARFLYISRKLDLQLRRANAGAIRPPVTLLLARRDRIIDNARTQAMVEKLAQTKPRVAVLDAAHTMEFETDAGEYLNAIRP